MIGTIMFPAEYIPGISMREYDLFPGTGSGGVKGAVHRFLRSAARLMSVRSRRRSNVRV